MFQTFQGFRYYKNIMPILFSVWLFADYQSAENIESFSGYQRQRVSRGDTPGVAPFGATARSSEALKISAISGSNVLLPSQDV